MIRVQGDKATRRNRLAKWIRQDNKINKWLDQLENGQKTVLEFLVSAQNVARKLQAVQLHLPTPSVDEQPDYPVQLQAVDDPEEPENSGETRIT